MDQAQAYCCLSCSDPQLSCIDSPKCCAPCGECPECCEDCGGTSSCTTSAYFYNGVFYKHFKLEAQQYDNTLFYYYDGNLLNRGYYSSEYNTAVCPPCCKQGSNRTYNDRAYFYKGDTLFNCENTTTIEDYEDCDDCPIKNTTASQCYLGAALYTNDDPVPATQCFPQFPDFLAKAGTVACRDPNDCYPQVCVIDYPGSCDDDPVCLPFTFPCEEKRRRAYTEFYSKIEFFRPLNLYNEAGQNVGNTIGATYNPCTPTATWNAPACHFFHP